MRRETFVRTLIFACALLAAAFAPARAQGQGASLSGRVTDPRGAAVAGAGVERDGRARAQVRLTIVTDAAGSYRFERLAPGEYIVEAAGPGFAPSAARPVAVSRDAAASLYFRLEVAGVSTEVVVTASDSPQTTDEVSKATTTLTDREIEERHEYSVAEALRAVPGLRVQQSGGPGAFTTIKARGLGNQDTAVLVDGLRFRDPSAPQGNAEGYVAELEVTNLSRVEVVRGSGSSLYGTNAVGGVVNVVTDAGGGPFRGSLLAEGGRLGHFRGRAQVAGGTGGNRVAYSAGLSHRNVTRGLDGDDASRNTSGQGRALFRLTPTAALSARVYAADSFLQTNDSPRTAPGALPAGVVGAVPLSRSELRRLEAGTPAAALDPGGATFIPQANDPDASNPRRFFTGALVFTHRPLEEFGYAVSYQALRADGEFRDGPGGTEAFEPAGNTLNKLGGRAHTLNLRADLRAGPHRLTGGYEFERETFLNDFRAAEPANDLSVDASQRSHALFAQDELRLLGDRLHLSGSFRAQWFSLDEPRFRPSASAPFGDVSFVSPKSAYTGDGSAAYFFASTGTKLRGHVGNAYRAPSLFERFAVAYSGLFGFFPFGNPGLRPERALALDAGVDQSFAGGRVRASATYFYTRLQEVIAFNVTSYSNTRGGLARGFELSAEAVPARLTTLRAAYTYTNADERVPRLDGVLRSFGTPEHQFSLAATQRVGRRVALNFDLFASGDYLAPVFNPETFGSRVFRFGGPVKADLGGEYALPLEGARRLRLFGVVENLFGDEYYENGFRAPGSTARAGARLDF